uniref:BTB domain-containing protein n=1 Tax=Globodera pallida TaxID=36090 RepID=A0A183CQ38_GLOPA
MDFGLNWPKFALMPADMAPADDFPEDLNGIPLANLTNTSLDGKVELLVYCGDRNALFDEIREALRRIVPTDTYTISALSTKALLVHPWMDLCACLIIADTSRLDNSSMESSGKILFVCENSLLSSLTRSNSQREQSTLLKNAFGNKARVACEMLKQFDLHIVDERNISGDLLVRCCKARAHAKLT